ncbi:MAG TPA: cytochrome D1 domain-containing protein [Polyangiaceae bacterium]|nr:cytochrome D1 domain-containing protein [Polyangiaceae bacterium]
MNERMNELAARTLTVACLLGVSACGTSDPGKTEPGSVTGVHMAELNDDFTKVYLSSSDKSQIAVVDAREFGTDHSAEALLQRAYIVSRDSGEVDVIDLRTLELIGKRSDYKIRQLIDVGSHPTHMSLSPRGDLLAVMDEEEGTGAVSFIDTTRDLELKRLRGFYVPHFLRYAADGNYGYVANIAAHHLTRVDMETLEIDGHIPLDGFDGPPNYTEAPEESGFGDAQIDSSGMLYAAHAATGRVLVYDTLTRTKRTELKVGSRPWIAFAEHPFKDVPLRHLVPNFGDRTVSIIDGDERKVVASLPGDEEAYGVNFSSMTPDKAFVMNRIREDVAVVDTANGEIKTRIPVGGNTETAATTADGRWVIAAVSSANSVVVIDVMTNTVVKTFKGLGKYPWSVTIPQGQNYCH